MVLDPMLFKKFHKAGTDVAVPAPRPASPPPAKVEDRKTFVIPEGHEAVRDAEGRATGETRPIEKDIADVIKDAGFEIAFDIPAKEPTVEARGHAAETMAEDSIEDEIAEELEAQPQEIPEVESKEITVFEEPKVHEAAGPAFKDRLDLLDSLVQSELGISPYTIDIIRGHVKQIMMDLVTQPELDAILIDRDVHNVLAFIRHVKVDAVESREKAVVKKETKKAKDSKFRSFDLDLTALGNAISKGNGGLPLSLEDLSKFK